MRQRILVLGAEGFIGRRVVAALNQADWATALAAGRSPAERRPTGSPPWIQVDATDAAALTLALQGVHGVVDCVAGSAATFVPVAQALFSAAARMPQPPAVVHLSSMAVYGSAVGELDEAAPLKGDDGPYSAAKAAAERLASAYARAVILRPGIVYGPGSALWSGHIGRLLLARRLGDLGPAGGGVCNLVYVDDVAAAAVAALQTPAVSGRALNLSAPDAPTWNGYFRSYAGALGAGPVRPVGRLRLQWELNAVGPGLKLVELLALRSKSVCAKLPPAIRPWLLHECRRQLRMRSGLAESLLNLKWTPMADGLNAAAQWLLAGSRCGSDRTGSVRRQAPEH
jgi:nucleoside-diphosphate-sugar epimerase